MAEKNNNRQANNKDSISGNSAELFVTNDDSLAQLLEDHEIKIRDFIVLSFLTDQGEMSVKQLGRTLNIEPRTVFRSLDRLRSAALLEASDDADLVDDTVVAPSRNGLVVASKIIDGL